MAIYRRQLRVTTLMANSADATGDRPDGPPGAIPPVKADRTIRSTPCPFRTIHAGQRHASPRIRRATRQHVSAGTAGATAPTPADAPTVHPLRDDPRRAPTRIAQDPAHDPTVCPFPDDPRRATTRIAQDPAHDPTVRPLRDDPRRTTTHIAQDPAHDRTVCPFPDDPRRSTTHRRPAAVRQRR